MLRSSVGCTKSRRLGSCCSGGFQPADKGQVYLKESHRLGPCNRLPCTDRPDGTSGRMIDGVSGLKPAATTWVKPTAF
ncbi:hypothetical protein [Fibrella aquatica]|uniref:hypothetical protein n=1 Tax=Fibrella aquatica TaxID=3242487 RepID=UPI0035201BFA